MRQILSPLGRLNRGKRAYLVFALGAMTAIALPAQIFTTLHSFGGRDGEVPEGALVQAADGNLYGATYGGGANGWGAVFRITPTGTLTTIYSFCAQIDPDGACTDGNTPELFFQAADGNFYGTTPAGGAGSGPNCNGCGTLFEITPSGTLTTIYSFCDQVGPYGTCAIGYPGVALIQSTDGNFYGTTPGGGANQCETESAYTVGCGTAFRMTGSGTLTLLYGFCAQRKCADGGFPGPLVQGTDGNFYGTTSVGGTGAPCSGTLGTPGCGTAFKITPSGVLTTLYSFCSQSGCPDGAQPEAPLVQATDGNLYGTTSAGGAKGRGTVFKITPNGALTTLYSFCSQQYSGGLCTDGQSPSGAALIQGTDGNFYGITATGGDNGNGLGTIFRITPSGILTTLYSFCFDTAEDCPDGTGPNSLVQGVDGNLYGTTYGGGLGCGIQGCGTVFSLSLAPNPSAPAVNAGGVLNAASYTTAGVAPGSIVSIFGTNLAASTAAANTIPLPPALSDVASVTFNGIPAALYFVSQNQINAQFPFELLPGESSGTASIVVTRSTGTSAPQSVTVVPASPGIFTTTANGSGQAFAYDNTTGAVAAPAGTSIGSLATAPISIGSKDALIIACTGLGSVNPSIDDYLAASDGTLRYTVLTPTVLIGGVAATPIYSVLSPQFVSEYQIGVTPAANTPTGDAVSLQIQIGGVTTSNQVTIAVAP